MLKVVPVGKWICSDSDCSQHYKRVSDTVYSFIEVRTYQPEKETYAVCQAVVDLHNYTVSELREICSSYYPSLEEIVASYGVDESLHIIAECVFEQLPLYEVEIINSFDSYESASRCIAELLEEWT